MDIKPHASFPIDVIPSSDVAAIVNCVSYRHPYWERVVQSVDCREGWGGEVSHWVGSQT